MKVRALNGLQPSSEAAARKLASPPYDVVSSEEARRLLSRGVCNFLSVVRADATLAKDASDADIHEASSSALTRLEAEGHLSRPEDERLYVYELRTKKHTQRGVVALVSIEDYAARVIRAHETTRKYKEDERAALAEAVGAHTGPVLLGYRRTTSITDIVTRITKETPLFTVNEDSPGIPQAYHTIWCASAEDSASLVTAFAKNVPTSYIADGHHRAASAARVGFDRRYLGGTQMNRASDWFPAVLFPSDELRSRPYYRTVSGVEGLEKIPVPVTPLKKRPEEDAPIGKVYVCTRDGWFQLDVDGMVLQEKVLLPAFGISDPRTDDRVGFVGGVDHEGLERQVQETGCIVFAPSPVNMDQLMRIVDEGKTMPPKSTWFEPKLCSGLFVHTF